MSKITQELVNKASVSSEGRQELFELIMMELSVLRRAVSELLKEQGKEIDSEITQPMRTGADTTSGDGSYVLTVDPNNPPPAPRWSGVDRKAGL